MNGTTAAEFDPLWSAELEPFLAVWIIALTLDDIDIHSFHLHPLTGNLKGFWSITVRANWRIIFRFENGKAFDVGLVPLRRIELCL